MKPAAVLFLLIPVMPLPAEPPAAAGDTYATAEDAALEVNAAAGVSANDAPGSALAPAAGLVSAPLHGSVTLNPDGSFRYVPAADFFGPDTF
ncbi:MAG: Ig-like domain-containing protein [Verrucomicrobiota bacterium]